MDGAGETVKETLSTETLKVKEEDTQPQDDSITTITQTFSQEDKNQSTEPAIPLAAGVATLEIERWDTHEGDTEWHNTGGSQDHDIRWNYERSKVLLRDRKGEPKAVISTTLATSTADDQEMGVEERVLVDHLTANFSATEIDNKTTAVPGEKETALPASTVISGVESWNTHENDTEWHNTGGPLDHEIRWNHERSKSILKDRKGRVKAVATAVVKTPVEAWPLSGKERNEVREAIYRTFKGRDAEREVEGGGVGAETMSREREDIAKEEDQRSRNAPENCKSSISVPNINENMADEVRVPMSLLREVHGGQEEYLDRRLEVQMVQCCYKLKREVSENTNMMPEVLISKLIEQFKVAMEKGPRSAEMYELLQARFGVDEGQVEMVKMKGGGPAKVAQGGGAGWSLLSAAEVWRNRGEEVEVERTPADLSRANMVRKISAEEEVREWARRELERLQELGKTLGEMKTVDEDPPAKIVSETKEDIERKNQPGRKPPGTISIADEPEDVVSTSPKPDLRPVESARGHQRNVGLLGSIASATAGLRNLFVGPKEVVSTTASGIVLVRAKDDLVLASFSRTSREATQASMQEIGTVTEVSPTSSAPQPSTKGKGPGRSTTSDAPNPTEHVPEPAPVDSQKQFTSNQASQQRFHSRSWPSAPPSLSSIAHSLPTTSTVSSSHHDTTSRNDDTSTSHSTSHSVSTSPTSTNATAEETQEAALAAINAVIHSTGQHYTTPLTSRAALLHQNNANLRDQEYKLMRETELLRKDGDAVERLFKESNEKLKSLGDLGHWSALINNDLQVLEETLRIVEHGVRELDKCYACGEDILEDSDSDSDDDGGEKGKTSGKGKGKAKSRIPPCREGRWCGDCGHAWHAECARVGDDHEELYAAQPSDSHYPDPSEVGDSVHGYSAPVHFRRASIEEKNERRAPKPSSMFEWGGWLGGESDADSGSSSSSTISRLVGDGWRCWECNLKYDLEGIVDSLGEEAGLEAFDAIDRMLNQGLGTPGAVPEVGRTEGGKGKGKAVDVDDGVCNDK